MSPIVLSGRMGANYSRSHRMDRQSAQADDLTVMPCKPQPGHVFF